MSRRRTTGALLGIKLTQHVYPGRYLYPLLFFYIATPPQRTPTTICLYLCPFNAVIHEKLSTSIIFFLHPRHCMQGPVLYTSSSYLIHFAFFYFFLSLSAIIHPLDFYLKFYRLTPAFSLIPTLSCILACLIILL